MLPRKGHHLALAACGASSSSDAAAGERASQAKGKYRGFIVGSLHAANLLVPVGELARVRERRSADH